VGKGTQMSPEEIVEQLERNRPFYKNGGITVTGGEPLLQIDFMLSLFTLCKQKGIHTCIDTSGITYHPEASEYNRKLDELMSLTDLVMLDIKHTDPKAHHKLTGQDNTGILAFAKYLDIKNVPIMIRHVLVPGITSDPAHLKELGRFMAGLKNVKSLDVLPYHVLGIRKYRELGIDYPLEGVAPATKEEALQARNIILSAYRFYKAKATSK
jgi:pyruvate formate lyase activating enzyme